MMGRQRNANNSQIRGN